MTFNWLPKLAHDAVQLSIRVQNAALWCAWSKQVLPPSIWGFHKPGAKLPRSCTPLRLLRPAPPGSVQGIVIRFLRHENIACAVQDMQHRDDAVAFVNRVNNPVAMPPPVKQVAQIPVFGSGRASGPVFVEA